MRLKRLTPVIIAILTVSSGEGVQAQQPGSTSNSSSTPGSAPRSTPVTSSTATQRQVKPAPKVPDLKIPGLKMSSKIPSNFPVPSYPSNVTETAFMHSTAGAPTASATVKTKDPPAAVFDWYKATCKSKGWQVRVPSSEAKQAAGKAQLHSMSCSKDRHQVYIHCTGLPEGGTMINMSWSYRGVQTP